MKIKATYYLLMIKDFQQFSSMLTLRQNQDIFTVIQGFPGLVWMAKKWPEMVLKRATVFNREAVLKVCLSKTL